MRSLHVRFCSYSSVYESFTGIGFRSPLVHAFETKQMVAKAVVTRGRDGSAWSDDEFRTRFRCTSELRFERVPDSAHVSCGDEIATTLIESKAARRFRVDHFASRAMMR